ncbi:MAG TPA: hypothetical protein PK530_08250 [Anaerolineales bacterium]|nr:hypothetical protein [Anaerolineales bacterium]
MKRTKFFRKYRVEILLAFLAGIAMLILVGDATLTAAIQAFNGFFVTIWNIFSESWKTLQTNLSVGAPSDIIAVGILLLVVFLIPWRIRLWLQKAPRFNVRTCPQCGSRIHRARRNLLDRMVGAVLFIPLRRYACIERKCGWHGLVTAQSRQIEAEPFAK